MASTSDGVISSRCAPQSAYTRSIHSYGRNVIPASGEIVIDIARNGDWPPFEALRALAVSAAGAEECVTLNLNGIDYLDCGALQLLLALYAERKQRGSALNLTNVSPSLGQWFTVAGADAFLMPPSTHPDKAILSHS